MKNKQQMDFENTGFQENTQIIPPSSGAPTSDRDLHDEVSIAPVETTGTARATPSPADVAQLSEEESRLVAEFRRRKGERALVPCFKENDIDITGSENLLESQLMKVSGSVNIDFANTLLGLAAEACKPGESDARILNALMAAMGGIAPRDEKEGMLAEQLAVVHRHAMQAHVMAARNAKNPVLYPMFINQATRLHRAFAQLFEVLARSRRKGEQRMTIEHIHIGAGAQTVIGNVSARDEGRGGLNEK